MDPQMAWNEMVDAYHELDWDRVRGLAEGLLQWMNGGGFPPETSAVNTIADTVHNERPRSSGCEWNRAVAQAACRYSLDLANQVLSDPNGIPRGVPFSLSCCKCDLDSPSSYEEAVDTGWTDIRFVPQSLAENFIGLCPNCCQLGEPAP
jgi:hypothetical protein